MKELPNSAAVYEAVHVAFNSNNATPTAENPTQNPVENVYLPFLLPGTLRLTQDALLFTNPTINPDILKALKRGSDKANYEIQRLRTKRSRWDVQSINGVPVKKPTGIFSSESAESVTIEAPVALVGHHPYKEGEESIWFRLAIEKTIVAYTPSGAGDLLMHSQSFRFVNLELELERGTMQFTSSGTPTPIETPDRQPNHSLTTATFPPLRK